jgi:AcrR family transcriptional regulator
MPDFSGLTVRQNECHVNIKLVAGMFQGVGRDEVPENGLVCNKCCTSPLDRKPGLMPAAKAAPIATDTGRPRSISQSDYAPPKTRRGVASRERLKAAAADVLNEVGYRRARVSDITARADVASGLFYRYFADLTSIAVELMHDLMAPMLNIEAALDPDAPDRLFEKLTVHAGIVIGNYLNHPGLMRSWHAIAEDSEDFRREGARLNEDYLEFLVTDRWPEENDPQSRDRSAALFRGYMLLGVVQGPMEAFNNWALPSLRPLDTDPDALTQIIAIASYRALTGHDPSPEALEHRRSCLRL